MNLRTIPFGSVCHLVNGKAFKPSDWSGAGIPIIRIQNLNGADKPFNYWCGALDKQVPVTTGDLLLAWSGTPGTSFGAHIWNGPNGILNQHIFRCDLNQKAITKEWAKIAVNHRLHRLIEQAHGGVGLQHVTRGMVEDLEIPLPPLPEQRRITEVLDRAEALRAKRCAALAQLDALTQALFLDLFGDPATNPKGWPLSAIGEVAEQVTDGEHLTPKRTTEGIKLLSARNIRDGFIDFVNVDYIDAAEYERISRRCSPTLGDVLISCSGSIGRVASVETSERFSLVRSAALVRPRSSTVDYKFLEYYLRTPALRARMVRRANASSQANLFQGQIRELPVYLPPLLLQREFARRVATVEKLRAAYSASLGELGALFATLQHRAFRGEL